MLFFSQLGRAKQQVFVVECTKGIVVFDDSKPWAEKLYIETSSKKYGSVPFLEPLRLECEHFLLCCKNRSAPKTDGQEGLRVIKVLKAIQESLSSSMVTTTGAY